MRKTTRFGISMDSGLLKKFDALLAGKGYSNRSEAIRDLVREQLVREKWEHDEEETVGTITIIYDHHQRDLQERLTAQQHEQHGTVISSMHVHLDHDHCLEVLAVKGKARTLRLLADEIISIKGVQHGKLVMTSSGRDF